MIKKFMLFVSTLFLTANLYAAESAKGLNVIVTSGDAQTQMMAMVLATMTKKQGKDVNIVLCSTAGDLAVKGMESPLLKPRDKSPKMLLNGLIKSGAKVEVCPLYLPNAGKDSSVLIEGISVAKPDAVATMLLDKEYQNLSY